MARFTYRLQSVLNIKLQMERQARNDFGIASAALNAEEEKLEALKNRRLDYVEEGRRMRGEGINVLDLKENERAVKVMDDLIYGQVEQVKLAERALERARVKLTQAIQERKVQESLRERAFEEYLEEEKRAEAKEIDELVSYRYGAGDDQSDGSE